MLGTTDYAYHRQACLVYPWVRDMDDFAMCASADAVLFVLVVTIGNINY